MTVKSLGEPLPETSNLYAWGKDQIIKLYDGDGIPEGWVEHVGQVDRALYQAGLPVPGVGDLIEIDGCLGQIYERIEGGSMAEALLGRPEADLERVTELAHIFAEVQARIHTCNHIQAEIPSQQDLFTSVIDRIAVLPPDLKQATLNALADMPAGDRLCHGDFHPYNVMMSPRGPIVIDWNNAHIGNPLEDVARSALILDGVPVSQPSSRPLIDRFNQAYLEHYLELAPGDRQQLAAWQPIVAAVRLCDNIPELEGWLLEQIRTGLDLPN